MARGFLPGRLSDAALGARMNSYDGRAPKPFTFSALRSRLRQRPDWEHRPVVACASGRRASAPKYSQKSRAVSEAGPHFFTPPPCKGRFSPYQSYALAPNSRRVSSERMRSRSRPRLISIAYFAQIIITRGEQKCERQGDGDRRRDTKDPQARRRGKGRRGTAVFRRARGDAKRLVRGRLVGGAAAL